MSALGVRALVEGWIRVPRRFFDDHEARSLPTPEVVHYNKTHYWIKRDDPAIEELRSDAAYYADRDGPDMGPNLRPAAKALLAALK